MIVCQCCSRYIDSDDDPDCFQLDTSGKDRILCEVCRDEDDDEERARFENGEMK